MNTKTLEFSGAASYTLRFDKNSENSFIIFENIFRLEFGSSFLDISVLTTFSSSDNLSTKSLSAIFNLINFENYFLL